MATGRRWCWVSACSISQTSRKLPFFSDLPLIGNLFRSKQQQLSDSELLIFLTPTVLPDDSEMERLLPNAATAAPVPEAVGP